MGSGLEENNDDKMIHCTHDSPGIDDSTLSDKSSTFTTVDCTCRGWHTTQHLLINGPDHDIIGEMPTECLFVCKSEFKE